MIEHILETTVQVGVPERLTDVTSWQAHVPFASWCVDALRPRVLVELGTHRGDSYAAFCQAVERLHLPTRCYAVDTWRGDEHAGVYADDVFEELREYHDARYSRFSRLVRSTFDEACGHFADGEIDLLHIDGLHTYEAVRHDFETWAPRLSRRAVVLLHDVNVREGTFGVWRYWEELRERHPTFTFHHGHGLGFLVFGDEAPAPARRLVACSAAEAVSVRERFALLGTAMAARGGADRRQAELREVRQRVAELSSRASQEAESRAALERQLAEADALATVQRRELAELRPAFESVRRELAELRPAFESVQRELAELRPALERARRELWEERARRELPRERAGALSRLSARLRHAAWVALQVVYWTFTFQLRSGLQRRDDARRIRRARAFDAQFYLAQLRDPRPALRDPLGHYLRIGARLGLDPSPSFSARRYLEHNPELTASGENPLAHFLRAQAFQPAGPGPGADAAQVH